MAHYVQLNVRVPESLRDVAERAAIARGESLSDLIRRGIAREAAAVNNDADSTIQGSSSQIDAMLDDVMRVARLAALQAVTEHLQR